jgi:hypothetical protein
MILLLGENLADLLGQRVFSKRLALADSIAIIANGLVLVIEVEPEHLFRIFRGAYRLRGDHRHFAEIVDLPREDQGVIEFLPGVDSSWAAMSMYWAPVSTWE